MREAESDTSAIETPSIERSRWRIDPARSIIEFEVRHLWGLRSIIPRSSSCPEPLELGAAIRRDGGDLMIEAATHADHRRLGMTWSPLGTVWGTSRLFVHGRLVTDAP